MDRELFDSLRRAYPFIALDEERIGKITDGFFSVFHEYRNPNPHSEFSGLDIYNNELDIFRRGLVHLETGHSFAILNYSFKPTNETSLVKDMDLFRSIKKNLKNMPALRKLCRKLLENLYLDIANHKYPDFNKAIRQSSFSREELWAILSFENQLLSLSQKRLGNPGTLTSHLRKIVDIQAEIEHSSLPALIHLHKIKGFCEHLVKFFGDSILPDRFEDVERILEEYSEHTDDMGEFHQKFERILYERSEERDVILLELSECLKDFLGNELISIGEIKSYSEREGWRTISKRLEVSENFDRFMLDGNEKTLGPKARVIFRCLVDALEKKRERGLRYLSLAELLEKANANSKGNASIRDYFPQRHPLHSVIEFCPENGGYYLKL